MKYFITGCESFVGRNLIKKLKSKKIPYFGVDTNCKNTKTTKKIDIRDEKIFNYIPNGSIVVHLAALSTNDECNRDFAHTIDINLNGTINLAIQSKKKKVKNFIFASSEWVYGDVKNNQEQKEDDVIDIINMKSHYALSKLSCESYLRNNSNLKDVTILRFGIIFAERSDARGSAFEKIFMEVRNNSVVTIGAKRTGRKFIHVSDIVSGIIKSSKIKGINTINLAGNKLITLGQIINESELQLNKKIKILETNKSNYSVRMPNTKKAKKLLKWYPEIDLHKGIKLLSKATKK